MKWQERMGLEEVSRRRKKLSIYMQYHIKIFNVDISYQPVQYLYRGNKLFICAVSSLRPFFIQLYVFIEFNPIYEITMKYIFLCLICSIFVTQLQLKKIVFSWKYNLYNIRGYVTKKKIDNQFVFFSYFFVNSNKQHSLRKLACCLCKFDTRAAMHLTIIFVMAIP